MIIEIKPDIFSELNNLQDVNYLLSVFSNNNRYEYYCEYALIKDTDLFKNLLVINQELIELYFNRYITNPPLKFNYSISNEDIKNTDFFNLEEAKLYFPQAFQIILENKLNDGIFLDKLIDVFKGKAKKIKRYKKNRWLKYENAGGCGNISNIIEAEMKTFDHLPKSNEKYLKYFVLIDSDKRYETEEKSDRASLISFLSEKKINIHILEKREIENYLPDEALRKINDNDSYLEAYFDLSPIQKDYFDIEKGFPNKPLNRLPPEIQKLYNNLTEAQYSLLRKNKLNLPNYKTEFPKLFNDVTQDQLLNKTKHQQNANELKEILEKITELL